MSALDLAASIRRGERRAVDAVQEALDAATEAGALGAFREVTAEAALERAAAVDEQVARGDDPGALAGVPVAIKDNIVTTDETTTACSRILEGYRSPFTATAVERWLAAGAVPIGKTTCDEFAMGSSSEHCAYGAVRNPWDHERVPGGSSGGSAAAVAADIVPLSLGSDTGGSVRQPAALCGVIGYKPTWGRISRWGLIAFGSSLDQIGPFGRTVADVAAGSELMFGADPRDATSVDIHGANLSSELDVPLDGLRLGVARQHRADAVDPGVAEAVERAIDTYRELGATIVEVDLELTRHGVATYYVIATAEASSNLARFDGVRYGRRAELAPGDDLDELYGRSRGEGFGAEVRRRILLGTYVLSAGYHDAYYLRALKARRLIREEFDRAFADCDAIIGPTSPVPAFRLGERADPLALYQCDVFTVLANIAGIPAISIPCGTTEHEGRPLPVGLQLQAPAFADARLLRIARMYEQAAPAACAPTRPGARS